MKEKIELNQPLLINGKNYTEFEYDALEITADQFLEACQRSAAKEKNKTVSLKAKENDYALHLYLGMAAVIAKNPEISFEDLERLKGFDTLKLVDIGWLFILRKSGETLEESNSEERFENTAELSTPGSKRSGGAA